MVVNGVVQKNNKKKYIFVCIFYYTHHVKNILLDVVCCKNPIKH